VTDTVNDRTLRVGSLAEVRERERMVVEHGAHEILVVALGQEIFAIGNICSHAEVWLDEGDLHPETGEIECPMHEGRFDLRTGRATALPCERPVPSYAVTIVGNDVLVTLPGP
jgi:nitrite reductase/ring-hydroxylating ferredoxin subunit